MSLHDRSVIPLRLARPTVCLIFLALIALFTPARAHAICSTSPNVTTCTSSGGITVSGTFGASEGSSNVVGGLTSVTNISLTLTNLSVHDLNSAAVVLVPPSGSGLTALDLLSGVCGTGTEQIGNSTFTLADSGSGTDNNSGMMSGVGVGTSQARSEALTCAPTTFPQGTPSTRRALPPTIPAEPILASTAAALTTSALSAKTAANWQAFPPQTLAFTVPTFFWPCNLSQERYNFSESASKKEDSG